MASFGSAIEALKLGKRVKRESWGIHGLYLYVEPKAFFVGPKGDAEFRDAIRRSDKEGQESLWVPTQEAILADDWVGA